MSNLLHPNDLLPECKGFVYRGKVNSYYHEGIIRTDKRLTLLKRKSCSGCNQCDWIEEHLKEESHNEVLPSLDKIKHGSLYALAFEGGEYMAHDGDYSDIETYLIEVTP